MKTDLVPASHVTEDDCCAEREDHFTCGEASREIDAVAAIQRLLLPHRLPEVPRLDLAVSYRPAKLASGDYYDFLKLPNGRWGFFIADVSGHGAAAAVVAAVVHATVRAYGNPESPADLLAFVNERLVAERPDWRGLFVTAFYAVFDPATSAITYSSAGHPPPRLYSAGRASSLDGTVGLPLAVNAGAAYETATTAVATDDTLVLYTDGVTEARNPLSNELFGRDRLDDAVLQADEEPNEVVAKVMSGVKAFAGGGTPADDQTLIVARFR
jgi:sigma-B regulation protein RsbU (phosphoserine phosphatase)